MPGERHQITFRNQLGYMLEILNGMIEFQMSECVNLTFNLMNVKSEREKIIDRLRSYGKESEEGQRTDLKEQMFNARKKEIGIRRKEEADLKNLISSLLNNSINVEVKALDNVISGLVDSMQDLEGTLTARQNLKKSWIAYKNNILQKTKPIYENIDEEIKQDEHAETGDFSHVVKCTRELMIKWPNALTKRCEKKLSAIELDAKGINEGRLLQNELDDMRMTAKKTVRKDITYFCKKTRKVIQSFEDELSENIIPSQQLYHQYKNSIIGCCGGTCIAGLGLAGAAGAGYGFYAITAGPLHWALKAFIDYFILSAGGLSLVTGWKVFRMEAEPLVNNNFRDYSHEQQEGAKIFNRMHEALDSSEREFLKYFLSVAQKLGDENQKQNALSCLSSCCSFFGGASRPERQPLISQSNNIESYNEEKKDSHVDIEQKADVSISISR